MSHLLQFTHSTQIESAILINLCRRFCDCKNHRERRTSNTVCMKPTWGLETTWDKTPVQVKCKASQPLLSFFFQNLIHITIDAWVFLLNPLCTLSSGNCDYIHKWNTAKSLIFKSVFSASPYLFRETMLYQETATAVPIHTQNTPTHSQCQFNPDSHLVD